MRSEKREHDAFPLNSTLIIAANLSGFLPDSGNKSAAQ